MTEKCRYDNGKLSYHRECYICSLSILRKNRGDNCPVRILTERIKELKKTMRLLDDKRSCIERNLDEA